MKKFLSSLTLAAFLATALIACKKDIKESDPDQLSQSELAEIKAAGFNPQGAKKIAEGYLVEGDMIVRPEDLSSPANGPEIIYANEEHYRTTNTVSASSYPTIKVRLNNSSASHEAVFSAALNEAIRRYNAESMTIKFQRVTSGANTTVVAYYEVSNTLGSAGFPTSSRAPYSTVNMNTYHYSTSTSTTNVNYIATIMAHELGHCIGFRHTDYMNRAYSCGGAASNEGTAGVGAIHIAGTPTGASAGSWMLACVGNGANRPFTTADRTALVTVY
ncbi:MAG: hypothetical protein JWP69_797 [Flaviaesturariibacter sp.]|nr:hypothetical protein [Flaviaesturariibacter sp.]